MMNNWLVWYLKARNLLSTKQFHFWKKIEALWMLFLCYQEKSRMLSQIVVKLSVFWTWKDLCYNLKIWHLETARFLEKWLSCVSFYKRFLFIQISKEGEGRTIIFRSLTAGARRLPSIISSITLFPTAVNSSMEKVPAVVHFLLMILLSTVVAPVLQRHVVKSRKQLMLLQTGRQKRLQVHGKWKLLDLIGGRERKQCLSLFLFFFFFFKVVSSIIRRQWNSLEPYLMNDLLLAVM